MQGQQSQLVICIHFRFHASSWLQAPLRLTCTAAAGRPPVLVPCLQRHLKVLLLLLLLLLWLLPCPATRLESSDCLRLPAALHRHCWSARHLKSCVMVHLHRLHEICRTRQATWLFQGMPPLQTVQHPQAQLIVMHQLRLVMQLQLEWIG